MRIAELNLPTDTSTIEWSLGGQSDETNNNAHPRVSASNVFPMATATTDSHFSARVSGVKDNSNYLKSEAYINAKAHRGFVDRTRVLLHKVRGEI